MIRKQYLIIAFLSILAVSPLALPVRASCLPGTLSSTCVHKSSIDKDIWTIEISRRSVEQLIQSIGYHDNDVTVALRNLVSAMGEKYSSVEFSVANDSNKSDCAVYAAGKSRSSENNRESITHLTESRCRSTALKIRRYVRRIVASEYANASTFIDSSAYSPGIRWTNDYQPHRIGMYQNSVESSMQAFFEAYTAVEYQHEATHQKGVPVTTYKAKENDSLWGIAQANYGDGAAWPLLYDLNATTLANSEDLKVGDTIFLPRKTSGWKKVYFSVVDAKSISLTAYGTNENDLLVKTLCKPLLSDSSNEYTCILPIFDD